MMKQKFTPKSDLIKDGFGTRFEIQSVLFCTLPKRAALLGINVDELRKRKAMCSSVNVWRNHNFELIASLIDPFCAYSNWKLDFRLSSYGDTLMFSDRQLADVELLWLDRASWCPNLTSFSVWLQWLSERLQALREKSRAPIILATWCDGDHEREALQSLVDSIHAAYFADLGAVCTEAGSSLLDVRGAAFSGTSLSNAAQLVIARELACHWLPAAILPPIKAVVFDLDNTLHNGILGEDGIYGVELTPAHRDFQQWVKMLKQRGVFIALVSRNEREDVAALFSRRHDYPLKWEDFSAIEASWGDKAAAIKKIAETLRISPDAMLFVDDNTGELANVASQLPEVHTVFAHRDANLTCRAVHFYPGLWRWKAEIEDAMRIHDLKASSERETLAERITNPAEYFRSLQVSLLYQYNPQNLLGRLADLCNKTNQFNLALRRLNQVEIAERMNRDDSCVASVQLKDRLSDSGVIAVIIAERQEKQLTVIELCLSCRALGRQLEDTIILLAIRDMLIFNGCSEIAFHTQHGPRNQPALEWLARLLKEGVTDDMKSHSLKAQRALNFVAPEGVTLIKE